MVKADKETDRQSGDGSMRTVIYGVAAGTCIVIAVVSVVRFSAPAGPPNPAQVATARGGSLFDFPKTAGEAPVTQPTVVVPPEMLSAPAPPSTVSLSLAASIVLICTLAGKPVTAMPVASATT